MIHTKHLKSILDKYYEQYATEAFVAQDPISLCYDYKHIQDREIVGFFGCLFAWGNRKIIIQKTKDLLDRMDNAPFDFISNYSDKQSKSFDTFKHRTFTSIDITSIIQGLQEHFKSFDSLEQAFWQEDFNHDIDIERHLNHFYQYFFSLIAFPKRTYKHISCPAKKSQSKRMSMYLRWMVRKDIVDLGIFQNISPSQLIIPLDVHVLKTAYHLKILDEKDKANWASAKKITAILREFDAEDPVKYDFSLFAMSHEHLFS
ncbi:MAG: TIGR02757 family protein [Chitinophagales bacterium]|nr:TIGR02757 family protein [Chitinophagales bacterium]